MDPLTLLKAKVAKVIKDEVFQDVDGYWKWAPMGQKGALGEPELLMICTLLKEANRLWEKEINAYFSG